MQIDSAAIRSIMIERQLGVAELGKMAGLQETTISRITRKNNQKVTFKTVGKLSRALNLDYKEFTKEI